MESEPFTNCTRRSILVAILAGVVFARAPIGQMAAKAEAITMSIQCTFAGQTFTARLYDNPSARDFVSMLPLDLSIADYSTNEKIAYLPRKLTEDGHGHFRARTAGRPLLLRALGQPRVLLRRLSIFAWANTARSP